MSLRPAALVLLGGCAHRVCCNSYTYGPPQFYPMSVSPAGTAANPVNEPISASFTITASEPKRHDVYPLDLELFTG